MIDNYILLILIIIIIIISIISVYIINIISLIISIILWFIHLIQWINLSIINNYKNIVILYFKNNLQNEINGISILFLILTSLTYPICVLVSWKNVLFNKKTFILLILLSELLLCGIFLAIDLLTFYVFYEAVLVPLFILIGIWGSSDTENRIRASFLLFLFTLYGSLFILLGFVFIYSKLGIINITFISLFNNFLEYQNYIWFAIFLGFAIKQPLFPFHIWLNRAHAEAPVAGSIILAGLILKLATYGFLRILIPLLPLSSLHFSSIVSLFGIFTLFYACLSTLRQVDTKQIIAYSSIGHISITLIAIFSNTIYGIIGSILLSLAHGVTSPALFICFGGILYDRFHTRTLQYYRGLILTIPIFSLFLFIFTLSNIGTPLTFNFIGEFFSLLGIIIYSPFISVIIILGIILSACYSIWLYSRVTGGGYSYYLNYHTDINKREFNSLLPLGFFVLILGISPNFIIRILDYSVANLLVNIQLL